MKLGGRERETWGWGKEEEKGGTISDGATVRLNPDKFQSLIWFNTVIIEDTAYSLVLLRDARFLFSILTVSVLKLCSIHSSKIMVSGTTVFNFFTAAVY